MVAHQLKTYNGLCCTYSYAYFSGIDNFLQRTPRIREISLLSRFGCSSATLFLNFIANLINPFLGLFRPGLTTFFFKGTENAKVPKTLRAVESCFIVVLLLVLGENWYSSVQSPNRGVINVIYHTRIRTNNASGGHY